MERLGLTRRYAVLERVRCVGCGDRWSPDEQANAGFEAVVAEYRRMAGEGEADDDGKPAAPDNTRRVKAGAGAAADGGKGPRAANSNRRDGTRTAARLEERMRRRATRMALDVVRHQELLDALALREARALSRRWFILGRALDAALAASSAEAAALLAALEPHVTRPDERMLLGWDGAEDRDP